ncbi:glycoside hydrolase [Panus rudis PR-1116 ss-1]|nr:glycoside hydrolase [Panus rudis PR-1116 ss-1]
MPAQNQGYTNVDAPYGNKDYSSSQWLEQQQSGNRKAKWIVVGSLIGLAILVAVGVTVGVVVSKNNSKNNASGASSSSSGSSTGAVKQSNPNDPSTFEKDPNLKHSFYGLAYTPEGSQYPACGNSLDAVIEDIQLISQLTSRIRLYGADCNQSALVLEAIQRTKVDLGVYLGNYNIPTDDAPYIRQRDAIIDALKTYGADHVLGVTVGNEYMLNYLNANGAQDPNSAIGNAGAQLLIPNITDTRNAIAELNLGKTIPVGTADAGSYFNNEVLAAVDYGMSNVHPWFANVSIDQAADWTAQFFQETNVAVAQTLSNKPQMFIAETGWPSQSSDAGNESNGPSTASEENLQKFLDTFVCQANQNNTGYFYFEYFDEEWKDKQFGGVEGWWGLFHRNKTLKAITIPDCHID